MSRDAADREPSAVWTLPNIISFGRILLIPVFVALIVHHGSERAGLLLFGAVAASDFLDGYLARRTGRVSELGKLLDPTADRLAIGAGLIAITVRGALPLWAALLILVRDGLILVAGLVLLVVRHRRVEVRRLGKAATFALMAGVPLVAWGRLDLPLPAAALALGWTLFWVGLVESYIVTVGYAGDLAAAWRGEETSDRAL